MSEIALLDKTLGQQLVSKFPKEYGFNNELGISTGKNNCTWCSILREPNIGWCNKHGGMEIVTKSIILKHKNHIWALKYPYHLWFCADCLRPITTGLSIRLSEAALLAIVTPIDSFQLNEFFEDLGVGKMKIANGSIESIEFDEMDEEITIREGKISPALIKKRTRSQKLRDFVIDEFKRDHNGKLHCQLCGFSYEKKYGELGHNMIIAHHTTPVNEKNGASVPLSQAKKDICLVCANCHHIIHNSGESNIEKLKVIIKDNEVLV